jgi:hypothetical protein
MKERVEIDGNGARVLCCAAGGGEVDSVFKGYISRDRRKPHIVEADRAAAQLLRRARAAGERHLKQSRCVGYCVVLLMLRSSSADTAEERRQGNVAQRYAAKSAARGMWRKDMLQRAPPGECGAQICCII